jgi:hypothetical protein
MILPPGQILTKWQEFEAAVLKGQSDAARDFQRLSFYTGAFVLMDLIRDIMNNAPPGTAAERLDAITIEIDQYFQARFAEAGIDTERARRQ